MSAVLTGAEEGHFVAGNQSYQKSPANETQRKPGFSLANHVDSQATLKPASQKPGFEPSLLNPRNARPRLRRITRSKFIPPKFNRVARTLPVTMSFSNGFALKLVNRDDVALAIAGPPVLRETNTGAARQPEHK